MSVEVLNRVRGVSAASMQLLFAEARAGSREALGQLFQLCTPYLVSVARKELPVALHAKLDAEDVVQQTFLDAQIAFRRFRGCTRYRLVHWLRSILIHNLRDAVRRYKFTDKRCIGREGIARGNPPNPAFRASHRVSRTL